MKYALIIPDGCADEPQESLGGRTPLQAANVPAMDAIAKAGVVGAANHTPAAFPPGSDVANLSLLGYDPMQYFTGRAALEAAAQGIELGPDDWAIRCNLVTVEDGVMKDFTAGHVSSAEGAALLAAAQEKLGDDRLQFHPGVSYRNLLIYRGEGRPAPFSPDTRGTPPHDLTGQPVLDDYPRGPGCDLLTRLMSDSGELFAEHPVNLARRAAGKPPVTNIWLWGLGSAPRLRPFAEVYGKQGAVIAAVDLMHGLARLIGWRRIQVPGATGYLDTDYAAKGRHAVAAIDDVDLICVHVEATDEASHEGRTDAKVEALEQIDRHIVGPLHNALTKHGPHRILVCPDHPTPIRTKTHAHGNVPFAMAGDGIKADAATTYDDPTAARSELVFPQGWRLMGHFLGQA
ncbi:MAG: cofactor-independent phosphoglycerate mutase [Thermoguttaceae bacterium]